MGPIALFDKSFLQSLNVNESVWFDNFFLCAIAPVFYTETLADLAKAPGKSRSAEEIVREIASKFPDGSGTPCADHRELCIQNLLGNMIPMRGQIPMPGARHVVSGSRYGAVYDKSPEVEAFHRWRKREFMEIERSYAHAWREHLTTLDLNKIAAGFRALGIDGKKCKTVEQARDLAESMIDGVNQPFERLKLALLFFNVPEHLHHKILQRWDSTSRQPLSQYAPYAAFVLKVEVFFQLSLAAHLISTDRPSNRMDIAYLFYLPFCQIFISSDKLHAKCAPLFMRDDQRFVWGPDLKAGLMQLNRHFEALPEETKELGTMKFARYPPTDGDFYVARLYDELSTGWRKQATEPPVAMDKETERKLVKEMLAFSKGKTAAPGQMPPDGDDHETVSIVRMVPLKKGSWYILPKGFKANKGEGGER